MTQPDALREHLAKLLDWGDAHATLDAAVDGLPPEHRGARPHGLPHSPWQLVEHLRRAQRDILDFCVAERYEEMEWPADYWPEDPEPPSPEAWDEALTACRADLDTLKRLATDGSLDLLAPVPHGTGQTYLREILLVADHAAYHVGQIVLLRRLLGDWEG